MKSRETNTIVANVKKSSKKHLLFKNIENHIGINSLIMTNEAPGYKIILEINYGNWSHLTINHSEGKYGKKVVHRLTREVVNISTNGIEGFWLVFKRGVKGTYKKT